jgi:hypothetical protein
LFYEIDHESAVHLPQPQNTKQSSDLPFKRLLSSRFWALLVTKGVPKHERKKNPTGLIAADVFFFPSVPPPLGCFSFFLIAFFGRVTRGVQTANKSTYLLIKALTC